MNTEKDFDTLISAYLTNELNEEDAKYLKEWINKSNNNRNRFLQIRNIWLSALSENDKRKYNPTEAYYEFLFRTKSTDQRKKPNTRIFVRIAAAVAIMFITAGAYFLGQKDTIIEVADSIVEAPLGSRTKLYLPDQTLVWLNAGSTIRYAHDFGKNKREVKLNGEAYFEVYKDEKKPFSVITNELNVNVLGTKFNIQNYEEDKEIKVYLLEGKINVVNFLNNNEVHYMYPDNKAVLDKKTGILSISSAKAKNSNEWAQGNILFDEEYLSDLVMKLERSYNVTISFADDSIKNLKFYGTFARTEQNIKDIMDILASTQKLEYYMNGNNITISAKKK